MSEINKAYIKTKDGPIHYRFAGDPNLPAILLLHQTACSSAMYEPLIKLLSDSYFIFAPDTPGIGGSFFPKEPASIALYARVLREALDAMDIQTCFVFGHYAGASIAVQMEFEQPIARKMVLSRPPYLTPEQRQTLNLGVRPIQLKEDGSHLMALWSMLRAKDPHEPLALIHRELLFNLQAGERFHEAYNAVFEHDFNSQIEKITCPTLVMAGLNDSLAPSLEPAFHHLKNCSMREIRWIKDADAYVCERYPGTVAEIIRDFCQ
jgi:haloalkane dehalogenase